LNVLIESTGVFLEQKIISVERVLILNLPAAHDPLVYFHRLLKEVAYYKQEVNDNETKLETMKSDTSKDPYDIKQFEKVLDESYMMVPDSERRLKQALEDLTAFVSSDDATVDKTGEWFTTADAILKENCSNGGDEEHVPETKVDDLADGEAF